MLLDIRTDISVPAIQEDVRAFEQQGACMTLLGRPTRFFPVLCKSPGISPFPSDILWSNIPASVAILYFVE